MKVLMHVNHGTNKMYLLNFGKSVTRQDVKQLLSESHESAAEVILRYAAITSATRIDIKPEDRLSAQSEADFTISDSGYVSERL